MSHARLRRSPTLVASLAATVAGASVYLGALPDLWLTARPYAVGFAAIGVLQFTAAAALLAKPTAPRAASASAIAGGVLAAWAITRFAVAPPGPSPWLSLDRVIGTTDVLLAVLEAAGAAGLLLSARAPQPPASRNAKVITAATAVIALPLILIAAVGVLGSTDGFSAPGPLPTAIASGKVAVQPTTLTYCRPAGYPLSMDLYPPSRDAVTGGPAPVVVYVHGGGLVLGDRKTTGIGATLANHTGALFEPIRTRLNDQGFVVASLDYRLLPHTPWPGPIRDVKCAIRFLKAHAAALDIDPNRVAIWGSSAGAQLALLAGLAGPSAGFDVGPYLNHSSTVQAVVDMFGPTDLNDISGSDPFDRLLLWITFGRSPVLRSSASPLTYIHPDETPPANGPAFLILQGSNDPMVPPRQSLKLLHALQQAGRPATLIPVTGAGHGLDQSTEDPPPAQIARRVERFVTERLSP